MIPSVVRFHNLTIEPRSLLLNNVSRKKTRGPSPANWVRVSINVPNNIVDPLLQVDKWITENTKGRWTSYEIQSGSKVIAFFEDESEAILFKLCNGNGESLFTEMET